MIDETEPIAWTVSFEFDGKPVTMTLPISWDMRIGDKLVLMRVESDCGSGVIVRNERTMAECPVVFPSA